MSSLIDVFSKFDNYSNRGEADTSTIWVITSGEARYMRPIIFIWRWKEYLKSIWPIFVWKMKYLLYFILASSRVIIFWVVSQGENTFYKKNFLIRCWLRNFLFTFYQSMLYRNSWDRLYVFEGIKTWLRYFRIYRILK